MRQCAICTHHHRSVVLFVWCCNHSILITHSAELFASAFRVKERTADEQRRMKNEIVFAISGRPLAFAFDRLMKRTDKTQCFWHFAPPPSSHPPQVRPQSIADLSKNFMLMHFVQTRVEAPDLGHLMCSHVGDTLQNVFLLSAWTAGEFVFLINQLVLMELF